MPREHGEKVVATNRRARHDYVIEKTYEAGLVLTGTEVKSLRMGRATLTDGYAFVEGGEVWLDAVQIPQYSQGNWTNHAPRRKRKLLLHKEEIVKISHAVSAGGYTLVPVSMYFKDSRVKVQVGLCKGKKLHDKRDDMAKRDAGREIERAMKERNR